MAEVGVWGTLLVSTGWLRATAKIRVPINFQDFLHRIRTVLTRMLEGGWKTRQSLLHGGALVRAATASVQAGGTLPTPSLPP